MESLSQQASTYFSLEKRLTRLFDCSNGWLINRMFDSCTDLMKKDRPMLNDWIMGWCFVLYLQRNNGIIADAVWWENCFQKQSCGLSSTSCDSTPCDSFLWDYMKSKDYTNSPKQWDFGCVKTKRIFNWSKVLSSTESILFSINICN